MLFSTPGNVRVETPGRQLCPDDAIHARHRKSVRATVMCGTLWTPHFGIAGATGPSCRTFHIPQHVGSMLRLLNPCIIWTVPDWRMQSLLYALVCGFCISLSTEIDDGALLEPCCIHRWARILFWAEKCSLQLRLLTTRKFVVHCFCVALRHGNIRTHVCTSHPKPQFWFLRYFTLRLQVGSIPSVYPREVVTGTCEDTCPDASDF